jgi:hypothetical protein
MKKNLRMIAALAVFLMLPIFATTARAEPEDELELPEPEIVDVITEEIPVLPDDVIPDEIPTDGQDDIVTEVPLEPPRPFTPSGTGTVVDNATDSDGKEFYTIMTADESVFYLIIDRQRETENVYFLNAVTIYDLMALAEMPDNPEQALPWDNPPVVETEPEIEIDQPQAPTENGNNNMATIIFIVVISLVVGVAGWYFKVHKPKQQSTSMEEDYSDDSDIYNTADTDTDDDNEDVDSWYDSSDMSEDANEGEEE